MRKLRLRDRPIQGFLCNIESGFKFRPAWLFSQHSYYQNTDWTLFRDCGSVCSFVWGLSWAFLRGMGCGSLPLFLCGLCLSAISTLNLPLLIPLSPLLYSSLDFLLNI